MPDHRIRAANFSACPSIPSRRPRRRQLVEIDPTGRSEAHKLNRGFAMLGDDHSLTAMRGVDKLRETGLRFA